MFVRFLALFLVATTSLAVADDAPAKKPASPNSGKKLVVERVVAVVNDAIILASELEARMTPVRGGAMQIADP